MTIKKLLIANRGEVAVRIARAAADVDIATVAVYPADDERALHTRVADQAVALSGQGVAAYLDGEQLVKVALEQGCDAVHPGYGFLSESRDFAAACVDAGIPRDKLLVDPGFGFAKTVQHNLRLLAELSQLARLELPLLVGLSRKSLFGKVLDRPVEQRLAGSLAAAVMCVERGARIVRAHDVKETVDGVRFAHAVHRSL